MQRQMGAVVANELKPDDITFIGVLSACAQAGLLKQATAPALVPFLYILVSDYSQRKHGAFIEKIPDNVDAVMLGALLATCRKCKNVEVGERVINRIKQLELSNSWNYVVLSKARMDWMSQQG
uniref:Uncharacterized protein n=1 Tax=Leersia perrieri TaxID=77586 RepID=A0A0D9WF04_9ORYZ